MKKIDQLIEEGITDWVKKNPGKTLGGLGALAGAGLGAYHLMNGGDHDNFDQAKYDRQVEQTHKENEYNNNLRRNNNRLIASFNDHNRKVDTLEYNLKHKAYDLSNLRDFSHIKGQPSLDSLVYKQENLAIPDKDQLTNERDTLINRLATARYSDVGRVQDLQSQLSDEYSKLADSNKPEDILRKTEIAKKLTNLKVTLPSERTPIEELPRIKGLNEKIDNYGSPEQQKEWANKIKEREQIINKIDRLYGGRHADKFVDQQDKIQHRIDTENNRWQQHLNKENRYYGNMANRFLKSVRPH